jgi:beta-1,2-mannobiose phosphorylase / 1,2-beta-oligomannan phosphorylase
MQVKVIRNDTLFTPDPSRIIPRFLDTTESRSIEIIKIVLEMPDSEVDKALSQLLRGFSTRHRNISQAFERHFAKLEPIFTLLGIDQETLSYSRKALIGSCFTKEYSIESGAIYHPCIMEDPDQSELRPEEKRVIFSFRASGERNISSIVFRSGVLDRHNNLSIEPAGKMLAEADVIKQKIYQKRTFQQKLYEMQDPGNIVSPAFILDKLKDNFTYGELMSCLKETRESLTESQKLLITQVIWLASSDYEIDFSIDSAISERVIFPVSSTELKGIEDARFVKFTDDNGVISYYATYTANNGVNVMSQLIHTTDFYHFKVLPVNGEIAQNKGMALFPRKINGKYAMLCRPDGVNIHIAYSDHINIWHEAKLIQEPIYPWELIKIGNAGSPIETADGWLVITYGIGPMRKCVIGASLFDLDNPEKEIGRLKNPLISPNESEREGYVPNVIYSCGSIIHNEDLIIPYSMSEHNSTYATVNLKELLNELKASAGAGDKTFINNIDRSVNIEKPNEKKVA